MSYEKPDIPELADEIAGLGYESIQSASPGFTAPQASPTVRLVEGVSLITAEAAARLTLTDEQLTIREAQLRGINPNAAVAATVQSTWAFTGTHTVESGFLVVVKPGDGREVLFTVQSDVTATGGTGTGAVTLVAQDGGTQANELAGTVTPVSPSPAWVDSVTLVGESSGGVDAETYEEFLGRIGPEFTVGSDLIMKADQLGVKAQGVPGVAWTLARRTYNPAGPDANAPGHMTVALAGDGRANVSSVVKAQVAGFSTADGVTIHAIDFNRHRVVISASTTKHDGWEKLVAEAEQEAALKAFVMSFGVRGGDNQEMVAEPVLKLSRVAGVLFNCQSCRDVDIASILIGVDGGTPTNADKALSGDFPLTYVDADADLQVTAS